MQKFISKLSPKEKKIFNIAVVIAILSLFDRLFIGPFLNRLEVVNDKIETQKSIIKNDLIIVAKKNQIQEENKAFSQYFAKRMEADDVINAAFLRVIEKLATDSKVTLIKSNPSEIRKKKRYVEYYANIDCSGTLEDMISFMHQINSSDGLLKVVQFSMTPKRGTANEVNVSMSIMKMLITPNEVKEDKTEAAS